MLYLWYQTLGCWPGGAVKSAHCMARLVASSRRVKESTPLIGSSWQVPIIVGSDPQQFRKEGLPLDKLSNLSAPASLERLMRPGTHGNSEKPHRIRLHYACNTQHRIRPSIAISAQMHVNWPEDGHDWSSKCATEARASMVYVQHQTTSRPER
jgi:hypothetical protein